MCAEAERDQDQTAQPFVTFAAFCKTFPFPTFSRRKSLAGCDMLFFLR